MYGVHFTEINFSELPLKIQNEIEIKEITGSADFHSEKPEVLRDGKVYTLYVAKVKDGSVWVRFTFTKVSHVHEVVIYYAFVTSWDAKDDFCSQSHSNLKTCVGVHNNVKVEVRKKGKIYKLKAKYLNIHIITNTNLISGCM